MTRPWGPEMLAAGGDFFFFLIPLSDCQRYFYYRKAVHPLCCPCLRGDSVWVSGLEVSQGGGFALQGREQ